MSESASTWSPVVEKDFAFTDEMRARADAAVKRYPPERKQSAVLWLLWLAQEQNGGWLSTAAIHHVAGFLGMAPIRVHEVARFYTMFRLKSKGAYCVQVCRTTSCWIRGADKITRACLDAAGTTELGEVSADGAVSVEEVECLGACCDAPMLQINDKEYRERLTPERAAEIVRELRQHAKDGK
ncbi:MAG: NAD(P)H-dependent oxidoreductase subunit E [Alphaproteobacteria bacterium]|nr:NAD(P)H-dependent oxidoreductase subunit E [Alphaproteobacteria bacterium]MDA8003409.1 NAD(P)H-dependent oxidoreductase subunit E [Alphaproteobacteria bacterium]MDA8005222.1 NAD(P)H-dependent oxidoreductase subunit E [Alphaproteobacteria bacterium]MDA8012671.1 NAD(P)H-dependent oxidoreductase subunit E [Alphaproteobacteria bacterium]